MDQPRRKRVLGTHLAFHHGSNQASETDLRRCSASVESSRVDVSSVDPPDPDQPPYELARRLRLPRRYRLTAPDPPFFGLDTIVYAGGD